MSALSRFQTVWCAQSVLRELVLIYPVYAVMMGEHGVSALQLSILFMAWSGSVILLEVPTGTLADRFSRKHILVVSGIIKGLAFPLWLFFPNFWGYLGGFLIWGLGSSLASGTRESLVHDTLAELGKAEEFAKVFGRGRAGEYVGATTALAAGGLLAEAGYALPLALSSLAPWGAALLVLLLLHEPARSADSRQAHSFADTLRSGLAEARGNKALMVTIAMFGTVLAFYGTLDEYIGPLFDDEGSRLATIGLLYAVIFTASTLGVAGAHRIPARSPRSISVLLLAAATALVATLPAGGFIAAAGLVVYFAGSAAAHTLAQAHLQHTIRGEARATITSLAGMAQETGGVGVYLLVGLAAQTVGWQTGLWIIGAVSLVACAAFTILMRRIDAA